MNDLILRDFEPKDFDALISMRNDKELQHLLLAHPRPYNVSDVWSWIERRRNEPGGLFKIISIDRSCAGFVQIVGVHGLDRRAHLGICLADQYRGGGLGRKALQLALDEARLKLNLRKILVEVRADNVPALYLYRRVGFREVGVLVGHYRGRGVSDDVSLLELVFPGAD